MGSLGDLAWTCAGNLYLKSKLKLKLKLKPKLKPKPKPTLKPAGEALADRSILPDMMDVVRRLCGASVPFTVELFCGGVLGGVLRGARRMVAAQPTTDLEEEIAGFVFYEGVPAVVEAFGRAVPQARTSACHNHQLGSHGLCSRRGGA